MRVAALVAVAVSINASSCLQRLGAFDAAAFTAINGATNAPALDAVMQLASTTWIALPIYVALGIYLLWSGRPWRTCVALLVGVALVVGMTDGGGNILKKLVSRPRPCLTIADARIVAACSQSPSFPSNHAANAFAFATFVAVSTRQRSAIAFALAALVAYSRIHLGVHYPLDVVAGAVLGCLLGIIGGIGVQRLLDYQVREMPAGAEPQSQTRSGTC
jgi:undecaprenyl-diphosphatase